jgi:hypothetical protein
MVSIEWAAGLFEGEGSIVVRPNHAGRLQITVYNTDQDVIEMFYEAVGKIGTVKGPREVVTPKGNPGKPMYEWHAYSTNAQVVLRMLLPYFGVRRYKKAQEALGLNFKRGSINLETDDTRLTGF